ANPFLHEIKGNFAMSLAYRGAVETTSVLDKKYELMSLDQIYLDYAGTFPSSHPIHEHLTALDTGHRVFLFKNDSKLEVRDSQGFPLARLSNQGVEKWTPMLDRILEIRVIAMLQRTGQDPEEGFQSRIRTEQWELPVLEVVYMAGTN
ncbi:MAG: hypothetical protein KKB94_11505, partial [Proteobacteria bacterium]|nr:hypothetical protein [Pseudomonadota bacterium]